MNAGFDLESISSVLHEIEVEELGEGKAAILLAESNSVANRDFVLRFKAKAADISPSFWAHRDERGGFIGVCIVPPAVPDEEDTVGREVLFVVDQSYSQSGMPLAASKELAYRMLGTLRPEDKFNVIGFSDRVVPLWTEARSLEKSHLEQARRFIHSLQANGGTDLLQAIRFALIVQGDPELLRMVVVNTDGYIGNEEEILAEIQSSRKNTRVFSFGVGNSVNRFLIDRMAVTGRGASEVVLLDQDMLEIVERFERRMRNPVLTDVVLSSEGAAISDWESLPLPDQFDDSCLIVFGRYAEAGLARITMSGRRGTGQWSKTVEVELPEAASAPSAPSLWARKRVDTLKAQDWLSRYATKNTTLKEEITTLALEFGIMTEHTSFVAVEEKVVNLDGKLSRVRVPVERPAGLSFDFCESDASSHIACCAMEYSSPCVREEPAELSDSKIDLTLLGVTGEVLVTIKLTRADEKAISILERHGLEVKEQYPGLKLVVGLIRANRLSKIASLYFVVSITEASEVEKGKFLTA